MAAMEPFTGQESLAFSIEKSMGALRDLEAVVKRMGDVQSATRVDANTLKLVVRPGFSFIRGTMRTTVTCTETAPQTLTLVAKSEGIGMGITVESAMKFSAVSAHETTVDWTACVTERKGLVSAVGQSLIKAAADKVLKDGWAAVRTHLESTEG